MDGSQNLWDFFPFPFQPLSHFQQLDMAFEMPFHQQSYFKMYGTGIVIERRISP